MSGNATQILKDIVDQQRQAAMPELSPEDFFEIFSAEQITKDFAPSFEELEASIVDGEHDGGIDSIFTFVNGELVKEDTDLRPFKKNVELDFIVVQSKSTGGFSEDPIGRINGALANLLKLDADYENLTQYNEKLRDAMDIFRNTYRSLASKYPNLRIKIAYACLEADSVVHENLTKKSNDLIETVQELFVEAEVEFVFFGSREMLSLARQRPTETFQLTISKSLSGENGYVVLSKLSDLNTFMRNPGPNIRQDLFDANVRDYQGSTEVNSDIGKSLRENLEIDFWWLNNGITILGSRATLTGSTVTIENPQIVNGLQSSSEIGTFFDDGGASDDRMVMIKIVTSEDESVRDQIIKATNSQNSVPRASLRATDKVQRDIEHGLALGGYYYDRRKNFYKNQGKPAAKIISIPLLDSVAQSL